MFKKLSLFGLTLAIIYIVLAVSTIIVCDGVRGEGGIPIVLVTFPWIFLFLNSPKLIFYTFSVIANSLVWYFLGALLQKLANRLFRSSEGGKVKL